LENHINLLNTATREIERKTKQLDLARRTVEEAAKVIERHQREAEKVEEEARKETPNFITDWNGEPLVLDRKDNKDSLKKQIVKLRALVSEC
jgi:hypothetical protein